MLSLGFLNVCPIHVHLLLLSRTSADSWSVAFHNSTLLILSHAVTILSTVKKKHKIKYTKQNVDLTNNVHKIHRIHQTVLQNVVMQIYMDIDCILGVILVISFLPSVL